MEKTPITDPKSLLIQGFESIQQELKDNLPIWSQANLSQKIRISLYKTAIVFPVFVLMGLIIFSYIIYVFLFIYPLLTDRHNIPDLYYYHSQQQKHNAFIRGLILLISISTFVFLFLFCHLKAIFTSPGEVPDTQQWQIPTDFQNNELSNLKERRQDGSMRICIRCQKRKPDRAHHCKQCDKCILRMDHHCNWIANCVGHYNFKYFFLMTFYGSIALALFVGSFWECVIVSVVDQEESRGLVFLCLFTYTILLVLGVAVIGFCTFHVVLILNDFSTIEYCEKKRQNIQEYQKSPFSRGWYKNLQGALGENPLIWLVPYSSINHSGLYYSKDR